MASERSLLLARGHDLGQGGSDNSSQASHWSVDEQRPRPGFASAVKRLLPPTDRAVSTPESWAALSQWLEYRRSRVDRARTEKEERQVLAEVHAFLANRAFVGEGNHLTAADAFLYQGMFRIFASMTFEDKERFIHVSRWFNTVQQQLVGASQPHLFFSRTPLYGEVCTHDRKRS